MFSKIPALIVVLILNSQFLILNLVYAQDDFSDPGSQSVSSETTSGDTSQGDQSAEGQGPASEGGASSEAASGETGVAEGGGSSGPSLSDLASAATQEMVSCGCADYSPDSALTAYNNALDAYTAETMPAGHFQNELTDGLVEGANTGKTLDQVLDSINVPDNVSPDQIGAAVGAAMVEGTNYGSDFSDSKGKDTAQLASSVAADLIAGNGGNAGDILGGAAIAAQTALGSNGTGAQITEAAITSAASEVEANRNSPEFATAAFYTANTFGPAWGSPSQADFMNNVQNQLASLGISQENITAGAVASGVGAQVSLGAATARTPSQQAEAGPVSPQQAQTAAPPPGAPDPVPVAAPPPVPPAPPAPDPVTTQPNSGPSLQAGYSATSTADHSSEGKFTSYSSTTSFTGPGGYVGTVSITTTYDPGIPGNRDFPPTATTVLTSNIGGRDPNQQSTVSGIQVPAVEGSTLSTSQAIQAAQQAGISIPGTSNSGSSDRQTRPAPGGNESPL